MTRFYNVIEKDLTIYVGLAVRRRSRLILGVEIPDPPIQISNDYYFFTGFRCQIDLIKDLRQSLGVARIRRNIDKKN